MADLRKWEPLRELSTIQKDMDEFFRRVLGSLAPSSIFRREIRGEWYPSLDCYMKDNQFIVHADIPGVDPKNVEIAVTGNVLTIRGERKADFEEKKEGYLFHETSFGGFERMLTLPEGVDSDKIHATYRNGVLEVTMPAKAEALPRKIKVELEEGKKAA